MKLVKNIPRKLLYLVIAFFVIHFISQLGFLLLAVSAGMAHFDNPDNSELGIKSENYMNIYTVLSFPLLFLFDRIYQFFPELLSYIPPILGYIPFILNSALWSLGFYFLIRNKFKK